MPRQVFPNFCTATQRIGGGRCTEASGFSLGHTCHSVIGKTKHQFTRVELGSGRVGIAVTWLSRCIKETVLSRNLFSLSPSALAGGVSAWDSLNTLPHQSGALRKLLAGFDPSNHYATSRKAL